MGRELNSGTLVPHLVSYKWPVSLTCISIRAIIMHQGHWRDHADQQYIKKITIF